MAVLASATGSQASAADAPSSAERRAIMRLIAENWRETQGADGFLPYGFDFLADRATDDPASSGYIIREAGTFHGWAKYYRFSGDDRYREPIRRGIEELARRSIPVGKSRTQAWLEATRILSVPVGRMTLAAALKRSGLLYRPTGPGKLVSADGRYETARAGTTALALLAELAYSQTSGDDRFADLRSSWLDGLLMLQIPGGGFRESPTSIEDSEYYNGEAWLALAVYADLHRNDRRVLRALTEIDRALMQRYGEHPSTWFYSWGAMAAAERWRTTADRRFLDFVRQQTQVVVLRFEKQPLPDDNNCAAMEGLATALGLMAKAGDEDSELAQRVRAYLSREVSKLPRLQIPIGETRMPLGGDAYFASPRLARFGGAFLLGVFQPVTRVDAALHCLSALMLIDEQVRLDPGPRAPASMKR